jgi:hypothetical protein
VTMMLRTIMQTALRLCRCCRFAGLSAWLFANRFVRLTDGMYLSAALEAVWYHLAWFKELAGLRGIMSLWRSSYRGERL